jgi:hypothetical protein
MFQGWESLLQSAGVASTLFDKGLIFIKDRHFADWRKMDLGSKYCLG